MSIGYETMIPPINILTFYNAIANNGTMVRPRFVTAAMQGDEGVEEYPVEVINPKICSDTTLTQIRTILRRVVSQGLAKPAGSKTRRAAQRRWLRSQPKHIQDAAWHENSMVSARLQRNLHREH